MSMEELVQDMSVTTPVPVPPNTVATCVKVRVSIIVCTDSLLKINCFTYT